jgi:hypothetical protein
MDLIVNDFINERKNYITAIENCAPENAADYWRWQGHAEARRQLSERLSGRPISTESRSVPKEITGYVVIETAKGGEISTDDD